MGAPVDGVRRSLKAAGGTPPGRLGADAEIELLERIAGGAPLRECLHALLGRLEAATPGFHAAVLLLGSDGACVREVAAPRLPGAYLRALQGLRLAGDVAVDSGLRALARRFDLHPGPAVSLLSTTGTPLGLLLLHPAGPDAPGAPEPEAVARAARLAALALERQQREDALRQGRRLHRALLEALPVAAFSTDASGRTTYANERWLELVGPASLGGCSEGWLQLVHPDDRARVVAEWSEALSRARPCEVELRHRRPGGGLGWLLLRATPWLDESGRLEGLACTLTDVGDSDATDAGRPGRRLGAMPEGTLRRGAEGALRESEERYRALFDRSPLPMLVYDPATQGILEVNQAAIAHYGYTREEFLARTLLDLRPPEEVERQRRTPRGSALPWLAGLWHHRTRDGKVIDVEIHSYEITLGGRSLRIAVMSDVTERRNLEEQLRHAQKMEALGRLAGGVAHDFNNLVTAILGYSTLLDQRVCDEPARRDLAEIRKAGERAAALTRQLLAFGRKQTLAPEIVDLNAVLGNVEELLRRLVGEAISLRLSPGAGLGRVRVDPGQMEQVIVNLAVNARDAMEGGGELSLETLNLDVAPEAEDPPGVSPGRYVALRVRDTGCGMSAETQARIFEPFFTTKEKEKGTGLGLSTVYGIVTQSEGQIVVASEPGRGTALTVYLPRVDEEPGPVDATGEAPAPAGSERILLVEDDPAVRELARAVLREQGYRVLDAASGEAALELLRGDPDPIHAVLTDVGLPGMNGVALAREIATLRPEVELLLMSGYMDEVLPGPDETVAGLAPLLAKPFTPRTLLRALRQVLDRT